MRKQIQQLIEIALREDIGKGDVTTQLLFPSPVLSRGEIIAKEEGVICGLGIVKEVFLYLDSSLNFRYLKEEGGEVEKGEKVIVVEGDGRNILKGERVALNFLGHLSGIATYTKSFVEKVKDLPVYILDTRKRHQENYTCLAGIGEIRGENRRGQEPPHGTLRHGPYKRQPSFTPGRKKGRSDKKGSSGSLW